MKRLFPAIVVLFAVFFPLDAFAQTKTVVSATVVDPNGVPYAGGSVATQLVPSTGTPTINNVPVNVQNNPAAIDANGHFTISLWCNTAGGACSPLDQSGTQWQFTITNPGAQPPVGFGGVSFTVSVTITGTTQDISSTLNAAAVLLYRDGGVTAGCTVSGAAGNLLYVNNAANGCSNSNKLNYNSGSDTLSLTPANQTFTATALALTGSSTYTETVGTAAPVTPGSVTQRSVTIASDTILNTDRWNRVVYNSASAVAVSLPTNGSSGFAGGFNTRLSNQNTGAVTVTPASGTINGNPTLVLSEGQDCFVTPSSTGTNWAADCNEPQITAGANILLTRGVHSLTIAVTGLAAAPQDLTPTTNLFVNGYTQLTGAWSTAQVSGNSLNGAASTPAFQLTGTPFAGGTASTNFGFLSINPSTAAAVSGYSLNGEMVVINVPAAITGRAISVWNNGGANPTFSVVPSGGVTSAGSINSAAGSSMGPLGRTQIRSAADGRIALNNSANTSLGLTRLTLGTEAATNPAACPLSTIWDVCDGTGATTFGNTTLLSANGNKVFVTTNFTTANNTNLQAITGLTFNFPAVAHNWEYSCDLSYSQATLNAAVAFGIQAATNAPTNIFGTGIQQLSTVAGVSTYASGTLATLTTTTATAIVTGTPGATATNYTVHLAGMLELGASANAVSIMVSTATGTDAVTVLRGSSCRIF